MKRVILVSGIIIGVLLVSAFIFRTFTPGSLLIESTPSGAQITVDGKDISQSTPFTISGLRPGIHVFSVTKEGYHPTEKSVEIVALKSSSLSLSLRQRLTTGFLKVISNPPGAKIVLDGIKTELVTPSTLENLNPGSHTVELEFAGYEIWSETFEIQAEQTASISTEMKRLPERIIACIKGGTVLIDPSNGTIESFNPDVQADLYAVTTSGTLIAAVPEGLLSSFTIMDQTGTILKKIDIKPMFGRKWGHMMTGFNAVSWNLDDHTLLLSVSTHPATDSQSFLLTYDINNNSIAAVSHYIPAGDMAEDLQRIARGLDAKPRSNCSDVAGAYSPNGKRIAFIRDSDVFVADASNLKNPVVLSNNIDTSKLCRSVLWRPDGKAVLCFSEGFNNGTGYLLSLDGEKVDEINGITPICAWSPDGTRLAAAHYNSGRKEFGIYDVQNRSWQQFGYKITSRPAWVTLVKPVEGTGTLKVITPIPGAKVFIDGELTGKITPFSFTLPAGPHSVSIQQQGHTSAPQSFIVIAGKTIVANIKK